MTPIPHMTTDGVDINKISGHHLIEFIVYTRIQAIASINWCFLCNLPCILPDEVPSQTGHPVGCDTASSMEHGPRKEEGNSTNSSINRDRCMDTSNSGSETSNLFSRNLCSEVFGVVDWLEHSTKFNTQSGNG